MASFASGVCAVSVALAGQCRSFTSRTPPNSDLLHLPHLTSGEYVRDYNEVKALGRLSGSARDTSADGSRCSTVTTSLFSGSERCAVSAAQSIVSATMPGSLRCPRSRPSTRLSRRGRRRSSTTSGGPKPLSTWARATATHAPQEIPAGCRFSRRHRIPNTRLVQQLDWFDHTYSRICWVIKRPSRSSALRPTEPSSTTGFRTWLMMSSMSAFTRASTSDSGMKLGGGRESTWPIGRSATSYDLSTERSYEQEAPLMPPLGVPSFRRLSVNLRTLPSVTRLERPSSHAAPRTPTMSAPVSQMSGRSCAVSFPASATRSNQRHGPLQPRTWSLAVETRLRRSGPSL